MGLQKVKCHRSKGGEPQSTVRIHMDMGEWAGCWWQRGAERQVRCPLGLRGFFLARGTGSVPAVALALRLLPLPLAHGVGVAHDHLVHPGEGLWEEHCALEEAQVPSVQR